MWDVGNDGGPSAAKVMEVILELTSLPRTVVECVLLGFLQFAPDEHSMHRALWALTMHTVCDVAQSPPAYMRAIAEVLQDPAYTTNGITRLGVRARTPFCTSADIYVEHVGEDSARRLHYWVWRTPYATPRLVTCQEWNDWARHGRHGELNGPPPLDEACSRSVRQKDHNVRNLATLGTIRKSKKTGHVAWFSTRRTTLIHWVQDHPRGKLACCCKARAPFLTRGVFSGMNCSRNEPL